MWQILGFRLSGIRVDDLRTFIPAHGWTGYTSKQNLVFTTSGGDSCRVVKYLTRIRNLRVRRFWTPVLRRFWTSVLPWPQPSKRRNCRCHSVLYQTLWHREPEVQKSVTCSAMSGFRQSERTEMNLNRIKLCPAASAILEPMPHVRYHVVLW
jgi:hypothetical protein